MSGAIVALVAVFLYGALVPGPTPLTQRDVRDTVTKAIASVTPAPAFSERAYEAVHPSLVLIEVKRKSTGKPGSDSGLGSGVVVDLTGDILTSLHVVADATLGNPGAVRQGSEAFAVGNPFGLSGSMSVGVISALNRSFKLPDSDVVLTGLFQIDAAVNPGNSGGPLVDRDGNVIGIVTALVNPTKEDVFIGIGLAVPIDVAGGAAGLPPY